MRITLILLITLSSCMSSIMDDPIQNIHPDLEPYYYLFLQEAEQRGYDFSKANIEIAFTDHGNLYYGVTHQKGGLKVISIDSASWYNVDQFMDSKKTQFREVLMMHEFGHAFLHRDHSNHCLSVMKTLDDCKYAYYEDNRTKSLDELFGH